MSLNCPVCPIEEDGNVSTLEFIAPSNEEYQLSLKTNDGTRKWYTCNKCGHTFCRDKIRNIWMYSPATYIKLVNSGFIEDKLER